MRVSFTFRCTLCGMVVNVGNQLNYCLPPYKRALIGLHGRKP